MKVPFKINLSGKTAFVTGGSGTLCSAMAYGLAVCGAKVAIIGRNKEKLASVSEKLTKDALDEYNKNVIVKGYSCNVINKDELSAAYETIKNELGSCDILINGAGGNQPGAITSIEMLKKEKEGTKTCYQMKITKAQFKQNKARAILKESYDGKISHFIAALTGDDAITDVDEQELLSQIKAIKSDS